MFGETLVVGIIVTAVAVAVAVVVAVLLFRRRAITGSRNQKSVPPPVDPGPTHPEQARDVHSEEDRN